MYTHTHNSYIQRQKNEIKSASHIYTCMCCIKKLKALIPIVICGQACTHLSPLKELLTEGKVNGKLGKEHVFSHLKYQPNSLHNCNTEKESDRQIYPTPALCFFFRCIIHLCANLEEPSLSPS